MVWWKGFLKQTLALAVICWSASFAEEPNPYQKLIEMSQGMPAHLGVSLPKENYVPVRVGKLKAPKVLWINFEALERKGFSRPKNENELKQLREALIKSFGWSSLVEESEKIEIRYADRYGGSGIGEHGGSARSASSGHFSTKGYPTDLRTDIVLENHYNGIASFDEGIQESIKSSIAGDLPGGSNAVIAILDTGQVSTALGTEKQSHILIVREDPVRPAHFMINKHQDQKWAASEANRLQAAAAKIETALGENNLVAGLTKYAERLGETNGTAVGRRYFISANSPSNSDVRGRPLDYGPHTLMPTYSPLSFKDGIDPFGATADIENFLIRDFYNSIVGQLPASRRAAFPPLELFIETFRNSYQSHLGNALLVQVGTPEPLVRILEERNESRRLKQHLIDLLHLDPPEKKFSGLLKNRKTGESVPDIFKVLGKSAGEPPAKIEKLLERFIKGKEQHHYRSMLATKFSEFYSLVQSEAKKIGLAEPNLKKYFELSSAHKNKDTPRAYRPQMKDDNLLLAAEYLERQDPDRVAQHIQNIIDDSRLHYQDPQDPFRLILGLKVDPNGIAPTQQRYFDIRTGKTVEWTVQIPLGGATCSIGGLSGILKSTFTSGATP